MFANQNICGSIPPPRQLPSAMESDDEARSRSSRRSNHSMLSATTLELPGNRHDQSDDEALSSTPDLARRGPTRG